MLGLLAIIIHIYMVFNVSLIIAIYNRSYDSNLKIDPVNSRSRQQHDDWLDGEASSKLVE